MNPIAREWASTLYVELERMSVLAAGRSAD